MLKLLGDHVVRGGRRPPLIMWSASIFSIGHFLFLGRWPLLVFPALASASILGFGPYCILGFGPYCILGFGPYCIKGQLGPNKHVLWASL